MGTTGKTPLAHKRTVLGKTIIVNGLQWDRIVLLAREGFYAARFI